MFSTFKVQLFVSLAYEVAIWTHLIENRLNFVFVLDFYCVSVTYLKWLDIADFYKRKNNKGRTAYLNPFVVIADHKWARTNQHQQNVLRNSDTGSLKVNPRPKKKSLPIVILVCNCFFVIVGWFIIAFVCLHACSGGDFGIIDHMHFNCRNLDRFCVEFASPSLSKERLP